MGCAHWDAPRSSHSPLMQDRTAPKGIFLSYRRSNAAAHAGRIRDRLAQALPKTDVFMDIDSIDAGSDFEAAIEGALVDASHLLALVAVDRDGGQSIARLQDPSDYVRMEIKAALEGGLTVVPVLLDGARMPDAADLPADIQGFSRCNAIEVRQTRFDDDVANLVRSIGGPAPAPMDPEPAPARPFRAFLLWAICGAFMAFVAAILQKAATGFSLGYHLGPVGAVMFVPGIAFIAGTIGAIRANRKSRRA